MLQYYITTILLKLCYFVLYQCLVFPDIPTCQCITLDPWTNVNVIKAIPKVKIIWSSSLICMRLSYHPSSRESTHSYLVDHWSLYQPVYSLWNKLMKCSITLTAFSFNCIAWHNPHTFSINLNRFIVLLIPCVTITNILYKWFS